MTIDSERWSRVGWRTIPAFAMRADATSRQTQCSLFDSRPDAGTLPLMSPAAEPAPTSVARIRAALARRGLGGFELAVLAVTAIVFAGIAGLAQWGAWYSADFSHRLQ